MAKKILVETSARHVHLTDEHLKVLFGADAVLHKKKDSSLSPVSSPAKRELML